jgi:hypothetical protein
MKRRIAITDCRISEEVQRGLMMRGFELLTLPCYPRLSEPISAHTDMLITRVGDEIITSADYCDIAPFVFTDLLAALPNIKISFTSDIPDKSYPRDVIFNALIMGNTLFGRTESLSPFLCDRCKEVGIRTVRVNQGYPACTVLKLNDGAAITADRGMADILTREGIKVTLIEDGGIMLPPYEYGFIGGAAGVYRDTVYFAGDITTHPSQDAILKAISDEGMNAVSLSRGGLYDLGGILFLEGDA